MDKSVRGGKLYLKKGTLVDVHPGATADVAVDDTGDVLRVRARVGEGVGCVLGPEGREGGGRAVGAALCGWP